MNEAKLIKIERIKELQRIADRLKRIAKEMERENGCRHKKRV